MKHEMLLRLFLLLLCTAMSAAEAAAILAPVHLSVVCGGDVEVELVEAAICPTDPSQKPVFILPEQKRSTQAYRVGKQCKKTPDDQLQNLLATQMRSVIECPHPEEGGVPLILEIYSPFGSNFAIHNCTLLQQADPGTCPIPGIEEVGI